MSVKIYDLIGFRKPQACLAKTSNQVQSISFQYNSKSFAPAVDLLELEARYCVVLSVCVCVRDGLAASVCDFAYVALLLLPLSISLGVGAPSLSLAGFMF